MEFPAPIPPPDQTIETDEQDQGLIEGPYARVFNPPFGNLPRFTASFVKCCIQHSLKIQGKTGALAEASNDMPQYLKDAYMASVITVDKITKPPLGFYADEDQEELLFHGKDDQGGLVTVRGPKEDQDEYHQVVEKLLETEDAFSGKKILVKGNRAKPMVEADAVIKELALEDQFIRRKLPGNEMEMPILHRDGPPRAYLEHLEQVRGGKDGKAKGEAKREIKAVIDNLEEHRVVRGCMSGMNGITKRMFMPCGRGSTAHKIPFTGVKGVHGGSGMYGGLTGIGNDLIFVDPLLNGMHIEDLDPDKLNALDLMYFGDASAPNNAGTGLGVLEEAEEFAKRVIKTCVKNRIDRPLAFHTPVGFGRLHNGDVFWCKGVPVVQIDMAARIEEMLFINELRCMVHQGIYTFPEHGDSKYRRVDTQQANGRKDPYHSVGISAVRRHLRQQLETVAFGELDMTWKEPNCKDRIIAQGLRDVPFDPSMKIPTRATAFCVTAGSFRFLLERIDSLGLTEAQAINLIRGVRQNRFYKDTHDYKWNKKGANRQWMRLADKDKMDIASRIDQIYDGIRENQDLGSDGEGACSASDSEWSTSGYLSCEDTEDW
jgi:hypothetical protein